MALKLGKRISTRRCKWDKQWQVYECGMPHSSMFGRLTCRQCNNKGSLCASAAHPSNKRRDDY